MSASAAEASGCPNCGAGVPEGARFCGACGARVDAASTAVIPPPPDETGRVPVSVWTAEPHLFGVTPLVAVLVLAGAAVALGAFLVGLGSGLPGLLLLAAGAVLLGLYVVTARGERVRNVRDRVRAVGASVGARSAAAREATRLRHELERLRAERDDTLQGFGQAAYLGRDADAAAARTELEAVDARLAELSRQLELVAPRARERVARARLEAQPTKRVELGSDRSGTQE